jgi:hypothetical protein
VAGQGNEVWMLKTMLSAAGTLETLATRVFGELLVHPHVKEGIKNTENMKYQLYLIATLPLPPRQELLSRWYLL